MTHWEYPEAVERFGRQLDALGISAELEARGALEGDLIMIGDYDFDFSPGLTNPYIPLELLEKDLELEGKLPNSNEGRAILVNADDDEEYFDDDEVELLGFQEEDWDLLLEDVNDDFDFEVLEGDEVWTSS